ncbi:unnamed protein product [Pedinophyceae sp. YPF-701]|nr:unnamed protein product [Pedinophyceae sp. YPF-701]
MSSELRVSALYVYPIKSCKGVAVERTAVVDTGLLWDRKFVVVEEQSGRFFTQRTHPQMCLIGVEMPPESWDPDWEPLSGTQMTCTFPGLDPVAVPLDLPEPATVAANTRHVTVWEFSGPALDMGDAAAEFFSQALGAPARLVRHLDDASRRPCEEEFAPGHVTAFSDGFPVLVASDASLAQLNSELPAGAPRMDAARFRPNLLVSGCPPYDEDNWATVTCTPPAVHRGAPGECTLRVVKPCSRCTVPQVDQATGERSTEPAPTLRRTRAGKLLPLGEGRPSWSGKTFWGWNCVRASGGTRTVAVGDVVSVARR